MWKLESFNESGKVLDPKADWIIGPGQRMSAVEYNSEQEAREWLECWLRQVVPYKVRVVLSNGDSVVSTHFIR